MTPGARVVALALAIGGSLCGSAAAQQPVAARSSRPDATTISALLAYPLFYHAQVVTLRGDVVESDNSIWLSRDEQRVLLAGSALGRAVNTTIDVRGMFFDVGRLDPDDPRLGTLKLTELSQSRLGRDHPGIGELLVVVAATIGPALPAAAPTIRNIALDPHRYLDQRVSVVGRFRGRNLYGDLPNAPGRGRWDFVLHSASAAIWVTGVQPKGKDFNLNPGTRVDTGRWLQVAGVVKHARGLTWIEANQVALAEAPPETVTEVRAPAPEQPPPDVVFSAPTEGETDVEPGTRVRIQFSREMDPKSFENHVRIGYAARSAKERAEPAAAPVEFRSEYRAANRVLEVTFSAPLEPFRSVRVELLDGITAAGDAKPLKPWSLTFTVGR
jgi:hypothetical protein